MKKLISLLVAGSVVAVSGCAQKSDQISAQYVSPVAYESYSCRQVGEEAARISARAAELTGVQDKRAKNDAVATGVALVLFWPAAFFIRGDKQTAAELGRLKGELEALEKVSNEKNCGIEFRREQSADAQEASEE